jgi:hypothetical protein
MLGIVTLHLTVPTAQKLRSTHCRSEQLLRSVEPENAGFGRFFDWHIICNRRAVMHPVSPQTAGWQAT